MKKLLIFAVLLVSSFILGAIFVNPGKVSAQEENTEEVAKRYNVTFPIKELGNCADFNECREFCEDPVNSTTCIDFAKKKGFYKDENTGNNQLIVKAKTALGCTSEASCREICSQEENFDKCSNFARQNNLSGGHTEDPSSAQLIQKAKTVLGCSSESTCKDVCSKEENREKCSNFAKQNGLRGGERRSGPGGCTSEETCRAFCSDPNNYQICSGYASSQGGNFQGPGGCNSPESCKAYCEKNPNSCGGFRGEQENYGYSPEEMCRKTPNCSWLNNTCQCGSYGSSGGPAPSGAEDYGKYCRENPDKCRYGSPSGAYMDPQTGCARAGCTWTGNSCNCSSSSGGSYSGSSGSPNYDPARMCAQASGCTWTGSYCSCPNTGTGYVRPTSGMGSDPAGECSRYGCNWTGSSCDCGNKNSSSDPATECTRQSGCSWNGSSCNCSSTQTQTQNETQTQGSDPAGECSRTSGCSWTGSSCQCGGVQGANIKKESLLDKILNFFQF